MNKTNLINKFLKPTLEEVEKVSGISTKYEFVPKNRYKKIVFTHKLERKVKAEGPTIVEKGEKFSRVKKVIEIEKDDKILKKIEKAKRNIYVSKSWNKRADNKINRIIREQGKEYTIFILDALYKNLKKDIQTTLVQYINGIMKNNPKNEVIEPPKQKKSIKQSNLFDIKNSEEILEVIEIKETKKTKEVNKAKKKIEEEIKDKIPRIKIDETKIFIIGLFEKMKDEDKIEYKQKALDLFLKDYELSKLNKLHEKIYRSLKEEYIIRVIKMEFRLNK